jgi:hypothetical protein
MKSLDCNTPLGQVYTKSQLSTCDMIEKHLNCEVISTDTTESADIDAIFSRDKTVIGVSEIKSREMSLNDTGKRRSLVFKGRGYDSYLITFEKLEKIKRLSKALVVPGFLFINLRESGDVVFWKICDAKGNYVVDMKTDKTMTQATCNGGIASRENAYISLAQMKVLPKE